MEACRQHNSQTDKGACRLHTDGRLAGTRADRGAGRSGSGKAADRAPPGACAAEKEEPGAARRRQQGSKAAEAAAVRTRQRHATREAGQQEAGPPPPSRAQQTSGGRASTGGPDPLPLLFLPGAGAQNLKTIKPCDFIGKNKNKRKKKSKKLVT